MKYRIIDKWMLLLLTVLLTACSSANKEEEIASPDEDCYLDIYVYAPDKPIVTRADVGEIAHRTAAESEVKTLQIWVFKKSNGEKVGYLDADPQTLNETGQQKYRMMISNDFARYPENVDVYVVANAANYVTKPDGTTPMTLGPNTTRNALNDSAMIGNGSFGTTTRVTEVPADGLPMSAKVKNQPITGSYPTLRVGTSDKMTVMQLTRAVSKLRFVLCRITETGSTTKTLESVDGISLAANQIPTKTYLIPRDSYTYTYNHDAINFINGKLTKAQIPDVADPLVYAYETQSAQGYEDLINEKLIDAANVSADNVDEGLLELGLTYFRESDKQLTGTITYTYTDNGVRKDNQEATFSMAAPGDFLRNHSWIVYIYYMDSKIYTLTVTNIGMKKWETDPLDDSKNVYNW